MSDVRYPLVFFLGTAVLAGTGCSSLELARFAPPGLVKYEDIASEKPPNPAIQEILDAQTVASDAEYPDLSQTPSEKDRPQKRSSRWVANQTNLLEDSRDTINEAVEAERAQAIAETEDAILLPEQRDELDEMFERDAVSARAERRDPMPVPRKDQ